jgi:uncharacterized membrane protein YfcA
MFSALLFAVATAAGAIASVAGFAIGSLLTPVLASQVPMKTAVAAVSVPHLVGTAIRFWLVRKHVDRAVLWRFGVPSAAGGLAGALLHTDASSRALAMVFGSLLVFAGATQLLGYAQRWRLRGPAAWIAGAASGVFGGLVGNQGGIRSAGLFGFDLTREKFVATATAIALCVDLARMPVYLAVERSSVAAIATSVAIATAGVVAGTLLGNRVLARVPEDRFRRIVATIILLLGVATLVRGHA